MSNLNLTKVGTFKFGKNYSGSIIDEISKERCIVFFNNFQNALDGDVVAYKIIKKVQNNYLAEASILKVLKRKNNKIIGTIIFDENNIPKIILDNYNFFYNIIFENRISSKYHQHKCSFIPIRFIKNELLLRIDHDFGHFESEDINQKVIFYQNGIGGEFNSEVICESFKVKELANDLKGRVDLTNKQIFSVDSETAKDLDDTIFVEKDKDNYILYVSIADVSHYVRLGSSLDREAMKRGNSIYYLNKVIPMLPFEISNDLCSLNESGIKLTLTCQILLDKDGFVQSSKVYRSYIKNHGRLTYTELNDLFYDGKISSKIKKNNLKEVLLLAFQLYKKVHRNKINQGALSFEMPETKFIFDPDSPSKLIEIRQRQNLDAEKLIEEFMVLANQEVARFLLSKKLPGIFRIHPFPNKLTAREMLTKLQYLISLKINFKNEKFETETFKRVLNALKDKENNLCFYPIVLQAMAKAVYSSKNVGHFGLGLKEYLHFTSPIRRYADLVVHRILNFYLLNQTNKIKDPFFSPKNLENIALHITDTEIQATSIEHKIEDIKKAEFFYDKINQEIIGLVSSITNFGLFILLDNTIQGLVPLRTLPSAYQHDKNKNIFINRYNRQKTIKIGDKVVVKVIDVNLINGQIIFNIINL